MFWHCAANVGDGLTHFLTHLKVGAVGFVFLTYLMYAQLLICLGNTEKVGRKLGAAHIVEYVLAFAQPFPGSYVARLFAVIKASVAPILEYGEITPSRHATYLGCFTQLCVPVGDLTAQEEPLLFVAEPRHNVALCGFLDALSADLGKPLLEGFSFGARNGLNDA
jgi:hypothetical protein